MRALNVMLTGALCLLTFQSLANIDSANIEFYEISGLTAEELVQNIAANSPSPDRSIGYAQLNVSLQWTSTTIDNGDCHLSEVTLSPAVTITMPKWINKAEARLCLQNNWNILWQKVLEHEQRHVELYGLLKARSVVRELEKIPPQSSCAVLKHEVDNAFERVLARNRMLHEQFHLIAPKLVLADC